MNLQKIVSFKFQALNKAYENFKEKRKKEKKFLAELKKGTKVVTSSGIHGKLIDINETEGTVTIETGAGKIRFERAAISVELSQKYLTPAPAKK